MLLKNPLKSPKAFQDILLGTSKIHTFKAGAACSELGAFNGKEHGFLFQELLPLCLRQLDPAKIQPLEIGSLQSGDANFRHVSMDILADRLLCTAQLRQQLIKPVFTPGLGQKARLIPYGVDAGAHLMTECISQRIIGDDDIRSM